MKKSKKPTFGKGAPYYGGKNEKKTERQFLKRKTKKEMEEV